MMCPVATARRHARLSSVVIATVALSALLSACAPLDAGTSPRSSLADGRTQSDGLLARVIGAEGAGCASAVVIDGELAWSGEAGLADREGGRPIDASTRFDIASVSKQFTGLVVLRLVEAGELSLTDTVASVIDVDAVWADEVTIDQLLHHTSGVVDYTDLLIDDGFEADDITTQADAIAAIERTELEFTSGERFSYSNSNYVLLASIVEEVTNAPFATVLAREAYPDFGMRLEPASTAIDVARSYSGDTEVTVEWLQVGDGSIVATATELAEWGTVYANTGDPAVLAMTDGAVDDGAGARYGAGIGIDPDGSLWHSGGWAGYVSLFWVSADRTTVMSLLCNSPDINFDLLAEGLLTVWE